jgi:DnaJ-class molecular chaperone
MDYYNILGLDPTKATIDDIANSFRVNSVKHHPMRNKDTIAVSNMEFCKVCEAYDVLSQPWLK